MTSSASTATPERVVKALMEFKGYVDAEDKPRAKLVYRCPKPCCNRDVTFSAKSGFSNPYQHLRSCYARGKNRSEQDMIIQQLFQKALQAQTTAGGTILSHFNVTSLSEVDKAMYSYIRLIVMCNMPMSIVENAVFRSVSRFDVCFKRRTLVEVMLALVELVEKRVSRELRKTVGAIMHDGWTSCSTHYVAVYGLYCVDEPIIEEGSPQNHIATRCTLLSVSPMGHLQSSDNEAGAETTSFNAEVHLSFFRNCFEFYGLDFSKWTLCLIADNASTNLRISKISGLPHVGCNSHKLNIEVNAMVEDHSDLKRTLDSVRDAMTTARSRLKNAAILRNLTDLRPVIDNATRWSGKFTILRQWTKMRDNFLEATEDPECDIAFNSSHIFANKASRYCKMLGEVNKVTKSLQTDFHTLANCRDDLDALIEAVEDMKDKQESPFYGCRLRTKYIASNSSIVKDKSFEAAVVKIQKNLEYDLSDAEMHAVQGLLKANSTSNELRAHTVPVSITERMAKRRKTDNGKNLYMNCNFIVGSVAKIERLWSIAGHVQASHRRSMTPQVFEAILFLRENERFWDAKLVAEAVGAARSERVKTKLSAHYEHMSSYE